MATIVRSLFGLCSGAPSRNKSHRQGTPSIRNEGDASDGWRSRPVAALRHDAAAAKNSSPLHHQKIHVEDGNARHAAWGERRDAAAAGKKRAGRRRLDLGRFLAPGVGGRTNGEDDDDDDDDEPKIFVGETEKRRPSRGSPKANLQMERTTTTTTTYKKQTPEKRNNDEDDDIAGIEICFDDEETKENVRENPDVIKEAKPNQDVVEEKKEKGKEKSWREMLTSVGKRSRRKKEEASIEKDRMNANEENGEEKGEEDEEVKGAMAAAPEEESESAAEPDPAREASLSRRDGNFPTSKSSVLLSGSGERSLTSTEDLPEDSLAHAMLSMPTSKSVGAISSLSAGSGRGGARGGAMPRSRSSGLVRQKRLMKELADLQKRQAKWTDPIFQVELNEENLFDWNVKLFKVDPESFLFIDMVETGTKFILLNLTFPENFPFSPPFMRVVSPRIENGFVLDGGAICMELLTPKGWSSAYTIEAIVLQFAASVVRGEGRLYKKGKNKAFSRKDAELTFKSLVKTHEKYGWVTPPMADG